MTGAKVVELTRRLDRIAGALALAETALDAEERREAQPVRAVVSMTLAEARAALRDVSDLADMLPSG